MAFRMIYQRTCDYRRFNRQWRECRRLSATFGKLCDSAKQTGDRVNLLLMADLADECGFPVFANLLRTGGVKLKKRAAAKKQKPRECALCRHVLVNVASHAVLCSECDYERTEDIA